MNSALRTASGTFISGSQKKRTTGKHSHFLGVEEIKHKSNCHKQKANGSTYNYFTRLGQSKLNLVSRSAKHLTYAGHRHAKSDNENYGNNPQNYPGNTYPHGNFCPFSGLTGSFQRASIVTAGIKRFYF